MKLKGLLMMSGSVLLIVLVGSVLAEEVADSPIIPQLTPTSTLTFSTLAPNGDQNPYGVAFVPRDFPEGGPLHPGDILVSNFNGGSNTQGTGTTIVQVTPSRPTSAPSVFFQGQTGLGLTTALGILKRGFVLVGNVPAVPTLGNPLGTCTSGPSGQEEGVGQGSLLILDRRGNLIRTLTSARLLDGPWDLTINDEGERAQVFVSNVRSGTVSRLDLRIDEDGDHVSVQKITQIASGYVHRCDSAAFVVGPTGLALDPAREILYVASTGDNAIYAIHNALVTHRDLGTGHVVVHDVTHLHGPLGLVRARNGDLIASQGDAVNPGPPNQLSEIVEFTPEGVFVDQLSIDPVLGSAFGIALASSEEGFVFAAVDDTSVTVDVWVVK
jgi:hypothetical protein